MGSNLATDCLPRLGEPSIVLPRCTLAIQPMWTCPLRPGSHCPDEGSCNALQEPELEQGSPSPLLGSQFRAVLFLPDMRVWYRLIWFANCPIVSFGGQLPPLFSTTVGSTEPPSLSLQKALPLLYMADHQEVSGPKTSLRWRSRKSRQDAQVLQCSPHRAATWAPGWGLRPA